MIAADELIERYQLARNALVHFGTYAESTHPQNRTVLSLVHIYFSIVPTSLSDSNLMINRRLSTLPVWFFLSWLCQWIKGNRKTISFGIPMAWWEPINRLEKCYFLLYFQVLQNHGNFVDKMYWKIYRFSMRNWIKKILKTTLLQETFFVVQPSVAVYWNIL